MTAPSISPDLQPLADAVTAEVTLDASAAALITGLAGNLTAASARADAAIAAGATVQAAFDAFKADVNSQATALTNGATALSAAVVANTPAAPPAAG